MYDGRIGSPAEQGYSCPAPAFLAGKSNLRAHSSASKICLHAMFGGQSRQHSAQGAPRRYPEKDQTRRNRIAASAYVSSLRFLLASARTQARPLREDED
jgi:hypothetical protein